MPRITRLPHPRLPIHPDRPLPVQPGTYTLPVSQHRIERRPQLVRRFACLLIASLMTLALPAQAADEFCGKEGIWIQFLGTGGPELNDGRGATSYLLWQDRDPVLLINPGPDVARALDLAGASIDQLDAILFTQLTVEHSAGLAAVLRGSRLTSRQSALPLLGPAGNQSTPGLTSFVNRLIGPEGVYPQLADLLAGPSPTGLHVTTQEVPFRGNRTWSKFGTARLILASVPVNHGDVPAIAWRAKIGGQTIVFVGAAAGGDAVLARLSKGADALVLPHAIPEGTRGLARSQYMTPTQIGRLAQGSETRMVFLAQRSTRTFGRENQSREAIRAVYDRPLLFTFDMECWGL